MWSLERPLVALKKAFWVSLSSEELQQAFKKAEALHVARSPPPELRQVDLDVLLANPASRELPAQSSPL